MNESGFKDMVAALDKISVADHICLECMRFQRAHKKKPSMIALNIALQPRLTDEEISSFCAPVSWYYPTQIQSLIVHPDKDWIMMADENGKFIQFL